FFPKTLVFKSSEEAKLQKRNKVQVYYVGNLNIKYLDKDLLLDLIEKNRNVDFNLVGPIDKTSTFYQELIGLKNVIIIGKVSSFEVMAHLDNADILLLLYRYDDFPGQLTSSHKVLEYFACGKVTVS